MDQTCWLNGEFIPERDARISAFDRGFIFGDGAYEVTSMLDGALIDADRHLARLERSLGAIGMDAPMSIDAWTRILDETARRAGVRDGFVYMQVTRGPAERDFPFPADATPTCFVYARRKDFRNDPLAAGITAVSVEDIRWARRDIKSVSLLAQVLAKQAARAAGAQEAIMHEAGVVTEGASSTAWIVKDGTLITRPLSHDILAGVTRSVALEIAPAEGIPLVERAFTLDEAFAADELFITSATGFVLPVVRLDDRPIGTGSAGVIAQRIRERYIARAAAHAVEAESAANAAHAHTA